MTVFWGMTIGTFSALIILSIVLVELRSMRPCPCPLCDING